MNTIADLYEKWPTDQDFCRDVGIDPRYGATLKARNAIPLDYWPAVIAGARKRRISGVTIDSLVHIAAQRIKAKALAFFKD